MTAMTWEGVAHLATILVMGGIIAWGAIWLEDHNPFDGGKS